MVAHCGSPYCQMMKVAIGLLVKLVAAVQSLQRTNAVYKWLQQHASSINDLIFVINYGIALVCPRWCHGVEAALDLSH